MISNLLEVFEELNKLYESKEDQEKFLNWAGKDLADKFYKIKDRLKGQEKDIYYWMKKNPQDLESKINSLLQTKTKSQQNKEAQEGADLIYSDDTWNVYHIKTFEASKKYGAHTKWCITGKQSGWIKNEKENKYWNDYTKKGIKFYFYINKKDNKKYALNLYPNTDKYRLWDELDNTIDGIIDAPYIKGLPNIKLIPFNIKDNILVKYKGLDTQIIIPNNVVSIAAEAFINSQMESIIISKNVTNIDYRAFIGCSKLKKIEVAKNNPKYDSRNNCNAIIETNTNTLILGCDTTAIPNSVTSIKNGAFFRMALTATSFDIPNSITSIGDVAFYGCSGLTNIKIPSSVTRIGDGAFCECNSLTNINIPKSITSIGGEAFRGCSSLKTIFIPNSVSRIEHRAFYQCPKLVIYCEAEQQPNLWDKEWNLGKNHTIWKYKI